MNVALLPKAAVRRGPLSIERFLTGWIEAVNDYLRRQYREIIQEEPSLEKLSEYRIECGWLLRTALQLESLIKDPEFPGVSFRGEISGKLLQLQESWDSLNNPVGEAEAGRILQALFLRI